MYRSRGALYPLFRVVRLFRVAAPPAGRRGRARFSLLRPSDTAATVTTATAATDDHTSVPQPGGHFQIAAFFGSGWSDACRRPRLVTFSSPDNTIPVLRVALGRVYGPCNGPHMPRHIGRPADSSRYFHHQLCGASTLPTNPSTCFLVAVTSAITPSAATTIGPNIAARKQFDLRARHRRHCSGVGTRHCRAYHHNGAHHQAQVRESCHRP